MLCYGSLFLVTESMVGGMILDQFQSSSQIEKTFYILVVDRHGLFSVGMFSVVPPVLMPFPAERILVPLLLVLV